VEKRFFNREPKAQASGFRLENRFLCRLLPSGGNYLADTADQVEDFQDEIDHDHDPGNEDDQEHDN
jgi:hypothetical protein